MAPGLQPKLKPQEMIVHKGKECSITPIKIIFREQSESFQTRLIIRYTHSLQIHLMFSSLSSCPLFFSYLLNEWCYDTKSLAPRAQIYFVVMVGVPHNPAQRSVTSRDSYAAILILGLPENFQKILPNFS